MELVIKISDKLYNNIIDIPESSIFSIDCDSRIRKAIQNGTPLPKGHEYIDRNNAITSICQHYTTCERMKMLSFTPNIIKQEVADILMQEPTLTTDKEQEK